MLRGRRHFVPVAPDARCMANAWLSTGFIWTHGHVA